MTIKGITIKWPVWVLLLIIIGAVTYFAAPKLLGKMGFSNETRAVGINPWSAFGAELRLNNGMSYDPESRNAKDFGLKVEFKRIDDRAPAIAALIAGQVDAIWVTTDMMSTELFENSELAKLGVVQILFTDISRGADVVVADRTIKSAKDMKGKKVAYTDASASLSLLLNLLETANLTLNDIIPVRVKSGVEAAAMFQSLDVPIAIVWSPDDGDCIKNVEGSHILFSTEKARNIIMDGIIVRKADLEDKAFRSWAKKLCESWLVANAECNQSDKAKQEAAVMFDKGFNGYGVDIALDGLNKVRLCTYEDNKNLFGLNLSFKGVTGGELYSRMANIYSNVPDGKGSVLAKNPLTWKEISDESLIEEITTLTGAEHAAEPDVVKFTPIAATQEKAIAQATAVTSVKIIINFGIGSADLDDQAKTIIDREVMPYAKGLSGYRIRVEGNTDASGNQTEKGRSFNEALSYQRAQSVINYLMKTGKFDPNRFTKPIGWGSNNPVYPNESNESESAANRRTEISFINE